MDTAPSSEISEKSDIFSVGERIRAARKLANLTQTELAQAVNAARSQIADWESGRNMPAADRFLAILAACGTT